MTSTTITPGVALGPHISRRSIASVRWRRRCRSQGVVGRREVVVDRLRHADHREVRVRRAGVSPHQGVLAADRDQRVEPLLLEIGEDSVDAAFDLVRVGPAGADDRPAARQDPGDLARAERLELRFQEPAPALADGRSPRTTVERVAARRRVSRRGPGAIATAGARSTKALHHAAESCRRGECRRWT